jgi:two-component system phosphate regulon sensor histidine kinase PhoR
VSETLTERLTRAYDASPVGNCYLDKDLRYLHINSWLAEINGISVSEHLGRRIGEVLPGVASSVIDQLTSVLETGTPILDGIVTGETPSQPGVRRVFAHSYYPDRADDGTIVGISCFVQEVTHHEKVASELARSEERYYTLLQALPHGVEETDTNGVILFANEALHRMYGCDPDELIGKSIYEFVEESARDSLREYQALVVRERPPPVLWEGKEVTKDGAVIDVQVAWDYKLDLQGQVLGFISVITDVTELKRLENVRRDFVANASHELRTPVTLIRGFTETLLAHDDLSESDRRSSLEVVDRHARRLANIVKNLLELSRLESAAAVFHLAPVDVSAVADALIGELRSDFEEKRLAVALRAERPAMAWGDERAVEQILTNLIGNATQYTGAGGRIEIRIDEGDECVTVQVEDSGIGIPERDLDRVFERFYRVDKARSRAHGGTGLGLSIAKHLAQGLGGEISVESEFGKGSTFCFTLPVAAGP